MWADPEVVRHIGGRPFSEEEVWHRLLRYAGHWAWFDYGFWAVEDRSTGAFLGELGFGQFHRDIAPPITVPECGWVFAPHAHGKGLATEGVSAAAGWADANFGALPTVCMIAPEHERSIRVARRCGWGHDATALYHGQERLVLTRQPNEAASTSGVTPTRRHSASIVASSASAMIPVRSSHP
jgi:RimJ/RimL family protein N-acetyltransferase